jgi:predicted Zn-dependent protease
MLAKTLYGASLTEGRTAFSKAITLKPRSVVLQFNFARALLLNDPTTNRTEAVQALEVALAAAPMNHLEKIIAARARTVLDAANTGSPEALRQALNSDGF